MISVILAIYDLVILVIYYRVISVHDNIDITDIIDSNISA